MMNPKRDQSELSFQAGSLQPDWTPAARGGVAAIGVLALGIAPKMPRSLRTPLRIFGFASLLRSLTNRNVTDLIGWVANPVLRINRTVTVWAPVNDVYRFLHDFSNYPRFMSHIDEVSIADGGDLAWAATGPAGVKVRWHTSVRRILHDQEISWTSCPGSAIRSAGSFLLRDSGPETTELRAQLSFAPAAGLLGYAVARLLGFDPRANIDHDLATLRSLIEEEAEARPSVARSAQSARQ